LVQALSNLPGCEILGLQLVHLPTKSFRSIELLKARHGPSQSRFCLVSTGPANLCRAPLGVTFNDHNDLLDHLPENVLAVRVCGACRLPQGGQVSCEVADSFVLVGGQSTRLLLEKSLMTFDQFLVRSQFSLPGCLKVARHHTVFR